MTYLVEHGNDYAAPGTSMVGKIRPSPSSLTGLTTETVELGAT